MASSHVIRRGRWILVTLTSNQRDLRFRRGPMTIPIPPTANCVPCGPGGRGNVATGTARPEEANGDRLAGLVVFGQQGLAAVVISRPLPESLARWWSLWAGISAALSWTAAGATSGSRIAAASRVRSRQDPLLIVTTFVPTLLEVWKSDRAPWARRNSTRVVPHPCGRWKRRPCAYLAVGDQGRV
jgi:hypothetical protein